jgi:hypothetical protein
MKSHVNPFLCAKALQRDFQNLQVLSWRSLTPFDSPELPRIHEPEHHINLHLSYWHNNLISNKEEREKSFLVIEYLVGISQRHESFIGSLAHMMPLTAKNTLKANDSTMSPFDKIQTRQSPLSFTGQLHYSVFHDIQPLGCAGASLHYMLRTNLFVEGGGVT